MKVIDSRRTGTPRATATCGSTEAKNSGYQIAAIAGTAEYELNDVHRVGHTSVSGPRFTAPEYKKEPF